MKSHRSIVLFSMLKLNERELKELHQLINEMSFTSFVELIRDTEDEVLNSASFTISHWSDSPSRIRKGDDNFYNEIDNLRKRELRMPVTDFVDALTIEINNAHRKIPIPKFDSRRGLRVWLSKLVRLFNESEVYHFAMRVRQKNDSNRGSDWRLR